MSREDIVQYQFTAEQSRSEAAENGRKGGIESGKTRRRKKSLREAADLFLSLPVKDAKKRNAMLRDGVPEEDTDNQMAVIVGLAKKAAKGDSKAAKVLFELLDDGPADDASKKNNLLEAIRNTGEIDTDDLPEVE